MSQKIELVSQFEGTITTWLQEQLRKIANDHIDKFSDSYLKKIFDKDGAQWRISMHILKNKQDKYEGKFQFLLDNNDFYWNNEQPYKEPIDLVNHAFKHLKEHLASK